MTALVEELAPNELWAVVEPLLPPPPRPWWDGRVRAIPARTCFAAIVAMARTSTPWRLLLPGSWAAARQPRCRACQPHRGLPGRAAEDTRRSRNPRVERSRWSQLGGSCWRWRPDLAAQAAASHRADWPGFQARWKEERLWPDRLHGAVERENGRLKRENGRLKREPDFSGISRAARSGAVGRIQQGRGRRLQRCIDRGVGRGSGLKFGVLALSECSLWRLRLRRGRA